MLSADHKLTDGCCALCHCFPEDPFWELRECIICDDSGSNYPSDQNCSIVRWCCKVASIIDRNRVPHRKPKPISVLVPLQDILGPAIVIPDLDQKCPHTCLCLPSQKEWPRFFERHMEELVTEEEATVVLAELQTVARDVILQSHPEEVQESLC